MYLPDLPIHSYVLELLIFMAARLSAATVFFYRFSILFSSGDSGSGYIEAPSHCKAPDIGRGVSGKVLKGCDAANPAFCSVPHMYMCCNEAHGEYAKGFTFVTTPGACDKRVPCWC